MPITAHVLVGVTLLAVALACCGAGPRDEGTWQQQREAMVERQLRGRDITDERVLAAMLRVPRHRFIPEEHRARAYADTPVPIGYDQTISQPYIVAFMTQALEISPDDHVLEIGTGSGYQAAILAQLAHDVYSIEIVEPLAVRARETLQQLGYGNVHLRTGNGYLGWPEVAPFDRIIVTAAPDEIPPALVDQLKVGGLLAVPVGTTWQELEVLRRTRDGLDLLQSIPVRFVPMTGKPPSSR